MSIGHSSGVSVRALCKNYGAVHALRDVSFVAEPGEVFGLLGPNGAGKTTTLECILGLRSADSGEIHVGGFDALRESRQAKRVVGAQLQSSALHDRMTPRQAVRLFGSFYPRPVPENELLERFSLVEKADAAFDTLSGGFRQRLLLALAFVNRPRVMILDEPTVGLDPVSRQELHGQIIRLREEGMTVLLSTHDLEEAEALCDQLGILDRGRLAALGSPAELIARRPGAPRLQFRSAPMLDERQVTALPGVVRASLQPQGWLLETTDPHATIVALTHRLSGASLLDLQVHQGTLADAFMQVTGRAWADAENPGCKP